MSNTEIHHRHDKIFKHAMGNLRVARAMVENYLPVAIRKHFNLSTLEICNGSFIDKESEQTQSDMLYKIQCKEGGSGYVYLLWEHQSSYDKHMALRILSYTCRIMDQHVQQGNDKLPLVVPVLVYNGVQSPYPGSMDLLDAFDNKELARQFLFKPFTLLDLTVMKDKKLVQDIWTACPNMLLKHLRSDDFLATVKKLKSAIAGLYESDGAKLAELMLECILRFTNIGDGQALLETVQEASQEAGEAMTTLQHKWVKEGLDQGWRKGLNQGLNQGLQKGRAEGREEATKELQWKIVQNMLKKGLDIAQISQVTELPVKKVEELMQAASTETLQ